jgi:hypothetical protein
MSIKFRFSIIALQLLRRLRSVFKENPKHLILDEAQIEPQLFSELRGIIDADRQIKGRFILPKARAKTPKLMRDSLNYK